MRPFWKRLGMALRYREAAPWAKSLFHVQLLRSAGVLFGAQGTLFLEKKAPTRPLQVVRSQVLRPGRMFGPGAKRHRAPLGHHRRGVDDSTPGLTKPITQQHRPILGRPDRQPREWSRYALVPAWPEAGYADVSSGDVRA